MRSQKDRFWAGDTDPFGSWIRLSHPVDVEAGSGSCQNAHNGYLETILDTGYIGLILFLVFIFATLHAIGRVAGRDPARAWLLLSSLFSASLLIFSRAAGCAVGMGCG